MKLKLLLGLFIVFFVLFGTRLFAQDFMMQGYYWDYPKTTDGYNWADTLVYHADEIDDAGFTFISLPPLARANSGNSSNGYDPKDLFDYGEYGGGATGFGARTDLDQVIDTFNTYSIKTVADLVLNHRDGGEYENNSALENYDSTFNYPTEKPYPYDRYRVILPIGGSTGNGAGHYYFKVKSRSGHSDFTGVEYSFYVETNKVGNLGSSVSESEPNGGSDCATIQDSDTIQLGVTINADNYDYDGCWTDEFLLILDASDFNSSGDTIFITFGKRGSDYSDMYIYGLWNGAEIVGQLKYQTATKFTNMPSGRGDMDFTNFKPNNDRSTTLNGDQDAMMFYLDYDQYQQQTYDTLYNWADWNWDKIGVRGFRMDAVKHYPPEFVGNLFDHLHSKSIDPSLVVGEFFSANTSELNTWISDVESFMDPATQAAITPRIYDFSLRDNLRQACDDKALYDVRNIFSSSVHDVEGLSGANVITFVNNHDFRGESDFTSLIQNEPMLAYAYILTNNQVGLPTVFYPDYFGYHGSETYYPSGTNADPHGDEIKKIIEIHQQHIFGASTSYYLNKSGLGYSNDLGATNNKVLVYQLEGGPSNKVVVVAINFDTAQVKFHQELNIAGTLAVGSKLTDLMGHSANIEAEIKSSENSIPNDIWIDLPARSYGIWIEGDSNDVIPLRPSHLKMDTINETAITVSWTDNSNNEDGFKILAKPKGGGYTQLGSTTAANATSFTYSGLSQDTEYEFQVKASNTKGDSESANTVTNRTWVKWDGSTDGVWGTAANWESGSIVSTASKIIIPNVSNDPKIAMAAECEQLKIESGAHLEITPTYSLTVNGNLYNLAGTSGLLLNSSASGTATLINGNNNTDARVNVFFAHSDNVMWSLVAPPVENEIADVFLGEYLDYWNEPTELWVDIQDENTPLNIMQGYSSRKDADTAIYEGKLRAGTVSHSLDYSVGAPDNYTGWNLLGNPYPSNVDWDLVTIPNNMASGISIWDSDGGTYFAYSASGGGDAQARYLQVGQGFFVQAAASGVSLSFTDAVRTHSGTSGMDKSANASNFIPANTLVITVERNGMQDNTYLNFRENSSWDFDLETDVQKLFGYDYIPQVFTYFNLAENTIGAINSVPFPQIEDTVHLGFRVNTASTYRLSIHGANRLNQDILVYLMDRVSGDIFDIQQDSIISFDYQNSNPENRFDLLFDRTTPTENIINETSDITIYSNQDYLFITAETDYQVRIYNLLGQEVYQSALGHEFHSGKKLNLATSVYLVEVSSEYAHQLKRVYLKQ